MKRLTYLVYIIFWEGMVFGGIGYAVFVLNASSWWMLLAFVLGCMAYSPMKWIHGDNT